MNATLRIFIITSTEDLASTTIRTELLKNFPFEQLQKGQNSLLNNSNILEVHKLASKSVSNLAISLVYVKVPMVRLDEFFSDKDFECEMIIFATRHRSESAQPGLLCHTPGNWKDDTTVGGQPRSIAKGSGLLLHYLYNGLKKRVESTHFPFPVDQEVTHHGPTEFKIPMGFVELGSSEKEWTNTTGAKIIAETIIETCETLATKHYIDGKWDKKEIQIGIGFGGTHYMPNFKRVIEKNHGFPHTIPKYVVVELTDTQLKMIKDRVLEPIDYWVIDWKGLNSPEKAHIMPILEASGIPIKKLKELVPDEKL